MIISRKRRARTVKPSFCPLLMAVTEGTNIQLDKPIVLIGRHQECDIQIPSRKISRRHCCIALINDHLVVRDLGSTNGIRINGIKVVEGNLQAEDELTIGNMRYQVKWGTDSAQTFAAAHQHAIQAGKSHAKNNSLNDDESFEEPMAISDPVMAHPVLQNPPAPQNGSVHKKADAPAKPVGSLEIPDDVGLAPLDPPK